MAKKRVTKKNVTKNDLTIDVKKLTLKRKKEYTGPKFIRYQLRSRDNEDVMQIIADANNFYVGDDLPPFNPNHVCYRITEDMKELFIRLIEENDSKILNTRKVDDEYAVVKLKGKTKIMYYVFTTDYYQPKKKKGE